MRRLPGSRRLALILSGALLVLIAAGAAWLWLELSGSLPDYDGERAVAGLAAEVRVERDGLGTVTIRAGDRLDEARALGFVHAQERFFQMDLSRRAAAGELSALVGAAALDIDRERRLHQLRRIARRVIAEATPAYRAQLEAYSAGVNAGLAALASKPFEYLLLRQTPAVWLPEDTVLVGGAMYFDLQDAAAGFERNEFVARQILPAPIAELLYPAATAWDAPLTGAPGTTAVIPPAATYDLRRLPPALFADAPAPAASRELTETPQGSSNWALAGSHTADGRPLIAGDPHLTLRVPSIWFRLALDRDGRQITGASLPGVPGIVFGSNGDIAWAFTNTYGDWTDLVVLEVDPADSSRYRTPAGWQTFTLVDSPLAVAGGEPVAFAIRETVYGPVVGALPDGRPYAVRWVAHDPVAYDGKGRLEALMSARGLAEALNAAQSIGMPENNIVVADRSGRIGWTVAGPIPRRLRGDGVSLSGDGAAWNGWLEPDEYPAVVDPTDGRIWTANARVVDGEALARIGRGNYTLGARATQIRDRLAALEAATTADMLAIQLDDEARFLARWRARLLDLLADERDPLLTAVREAVRDSSERAGVDAVGYRIVRGWRLTLIERMTAALTAELRAVDPAWTYGNFRSEHWAWPLLTTAPAHLLNPRYPGWRDFERAALVDFIGEVLAVDSPADLAGRDWGEYNTVRVAHPLSQAVPMLSRWLDMPPVELPGDTLMPRVQGQAFGASARFAASPGNEAQAYFQMPGGQSGHPLSPYYGAGHDDWVAGRPTAFLPGRPTRVLRLVPAPGQTE